MSLRDEYLAFREKRLDVPFDEEGDQAFVREYFGSNVGSFCRNMFKELMDIEKRLDQLECDQAHNDAEERFGHAE